jgi:hypothetical protein
MCTPRESVLPRYSTVPTYLPYLMLGGGGGGALLIPLIVLRELSTITLATEELGKLRAGRPKLSEFSYTVFSDRPGILTVELNTAEGKPSCRGGHGRACARVCVAGAMQHSSLLVGLSSTNRYLGT